VLAKQYTLADNFFHSGFGGSLLNHHVARLRVHADISERAGGVVATVDPATGQLALDASGKIVHDGFVTPDGYVVNTAFTVNAPHPASVPAANLLPNQTMPTIGDRLSAAGVSWKWYSGGWDDALAGNPDPLFQFHHQPFAYFQTLPTVRPPKPRTSKTKRTFSPT
jgi:phospholipase C